MTVDTATLQMLMGGVMSGTISWPTFYFNLRRAELVPPDSTEEDELNKIAVGGPAGPLPGVGVDEETEDEEEEEA